MHKKLGNEGCIKTKICPISKGSL